MAYRQLKAVLIKVLPNVCDCNRDRSVLCAASRSLVVGGWNGME